MAGQSSGSLGAARGTVQITSYVPSSTPAYSSSGLHDSRGNRFAPDPLISEGEGGEIVFAELAAMASACSRELARLFYERGIQETRLVNAMRWREVTVPYLPEEINRATEIVLDRAGVLREEDQLCRAIQKEKRS